MQSWLRSDPYSTDLQDAVHRAERIRAALRAAAIFMLTARLAAPLAIDDELEFVTARLQRQRGFPMSVRLPVERQRLAVPVIESAGHKHGLRIGRVAGKLGGF